ncbi:hypothetical protein GCM10025869_35540 [Homoserinibacter gongjuensis]|uniref:DUF222 domain-containing protein n=1 Tax=Homoserinibacter gongjuensis TaxID=1162968 RepID=A0ABQ6K1T6_9MICO|nr:hypothetical protein GCM10025869_35540 [Homoserinibacter gongjuensis]
MRDEDDGLLEIALQADRLLLQFGTHDGVDGAERLVHEQDVGVGREGPRHPDALLLAARELTRIAGGERAVEPDGVEQLEGPLAGGRAPHPVNTGTVATLSMTVTCGSRPPFCMT